MLARSCFWFVCSTIAKLLDDVFVVVEKLRSNLFSLLLIAVAVVSKPHRVGFFNTFIRKFRSRHFSIKEESTQQSGDDNT